MRKFPVRPCRKELNLDGIWDFSFREGALPDDVTPDTLPATSMMAVPGCFDTSPDFYGKRGVGIYRRVVHLNSVSAVRLNFAGLGLYARVFWDGKYISECKIPYSTFNVDIEASMGAHELAVLVFNGLTDSTHVPLFTGTDDYYGFGGIYRSVSLEYLPKVFIERAQVLTVDFAKRAVRIRVIAGGAFTDGQHSVSIQFDDHAAVQCSLMFNNGQATVEMIVPNGKLWSADEPNLHLVTIEAFDDVIVERFGIREIRTRGRDILLNGEKIYLKGYNRHESHLEFGPVQTDQLMLDDLKWLRDAGANYVRCVHYQQDPRFFEICDEIGMLCWEESVGWGIQQPERFNEATTALVIEANRRMIRSGFNNPSIIFWSFMNEAGNDLPNAVPLYEAVVTDIHKEDTSRLVSFCFWGNMQDRCRALCDVISFHMYPGWIGAGDQDFLPASAFFSAAIADWIAAGASSPNSAEKPYIFSETGTCAIYGYHDRALAPWSEEFQTDYDVASVKAMLAELRITGFTIWQLFDTKSYTRGPFIRNKARGINCAGVLDEYRRPKAAYYELRKILRSVTSETGSAFSEKK